jgi:hypothetical protein
MSDYTGLIHFYDDKTMSQSIKRMALSGRHVVSNVKSPFAGYVSDKDGIEKFLAEIVDSVRSAARSGLNTMARDYYVNALKKDRALEAING